MGVPGHFDRTFSPVLRGPGTDHGPQTHSTCSPHDRLHAHGGLSHLSFSVWPLGGAKRFSLPSISRPSLAFSRTSLHHLVGRLGRYKFPRTFRTYYFLFGGQPPKTEILLTPKANSGAKVNFPIVLHDAGGGRPSTSLKILSKVIGGNMGKGGQNPQFWPILA